MTGLDILLETDEYGYCALVESGESVVEVSRRFGSWGTVPDDRGVWRDVLPRVAAILQDSVKQYERAMAREEN